MDGVATRAIRDATSCQQTGFLDSAGLRFDTAAVSEIWYEGVGNCFEEPA